MKPETIKKPWGKEIILYEKNKNKVKILYINKNSRLSLQYHKNKKEWLCLSFGEAYIELGDFDGAMNSEIMYEVNRSMQHRVYTKDRAAQIIEYSINSDDADIVRLQDDYKRIRKQTYLL